MEYKFKINEFEGPLDLLLHLIKESEMDIMDIEIVKLTDQYLDYINNMNDMNLSIASEYLVLASDLMYLKSKTLLPSLKDEEEEEEYIETRENLISRLIEYKKYKEVTNDLKKFEEERKNIYTKTPSSMTPYKNNSINLGNEVTLEDLVNAFKKYLERKNYEKPLSTKVTIKEISVKERKASIKKILSYKKKAEFYELFENFSKSYVVATFLSILELAKEKELVITQDNNFDKIYCEVVWWNQ